MQTLAKIILATFIKQLIFYIQDYQKKERSGDKKTPINTAKLYVHNIL